MILKPKPDRFPCRRSVGFASGVTWRQQSRIFPGMGHCRDPCAGPETGLQHLTKRICINYSKGMIKSLEDISGTKKRLSIEIPASVIEDEISKTLSDLKQNSRFPGFRKGKAPMSLVEKRYGKDAEADAIEKIIPKYYSDALKESKLKPVNNPNLEGGIDFKRNTDLGLTFTVEVRPEIKGLSYDSLEVTEIPVDISAEDIDHTLERLRQDRASYDPTEDAATVGDVIIMDYESSEDEKSYKDEVFKLGTELLPEAFTENLTGRKKGDKVKFEVEFPQDYYSKELAGEKRSFSVDVKEVKKVVLPAMDDELAKDLGFENLDELKARIGERLEESKKTTIGKMQKAELLQKLVDAHQEVEAPESLVEGEIENLLAQARGRANASGETINEEELSKTFAENARRNVIASLIIQEIGEKEGTDITEQEIQAKVVALAQSANMTPENVVKYYISQDGSIEGLRQSVLEEKVMDFLVDKATKVKPADKGDKGE